MLTFMTIATMLSMWITNSAVTAMLLPIVRSMLNEIFISVRFPQLITKLNYKYWYLQEKECLQSDLESGNKTACDDKSIASSSTESLPASSVYDSSKSLTLSRFVDLHPALIVSINAFSQTVKFAEYTTNPRMVTLFPSTRPRCT